MTSHKDRNMIVLVFVIFSSGPGIVLSVAEAFAQKHFKVIALCARDAKRLESEKAEADLDS